jgi:hypothetical protein
MLAIISNMGKMGSISGGGGGDGDVPKLPLETPP